MIYFVRHGETIANEQNYFAGMLDVPLTELGVKQAEKAAVQLKKKEILFDEVHVSTLRRSRETAAIIMEGNTIPDVHISEFYDLVERDFGLFSGENKNLIRRTYGYHEFEHKLHSPHDKPENGEELRRMYDRLKQYYFDNLQPLADEGKNILVVAHKYVIELFAMIVADKGPDEYFDLRLPNSKPMNEEEIRSYFKSESKFLKELSDRTIFNSARLILGASCAGLGIKLLLPGQIDKFTFLTLLTISLAISSFFVLLSVNTKVIRDSFNVKGLPLLPWIVRTGAAFIVLLSGSALYDHPGVLLLMMPPALTVPVISILLGGDLYTAIRKTIFISCLTPIVVGSLLLLTGASITTLIPFVVIFTAAMAVPGILAQTLRKREPILAGKIAERWKWTGVIAVMVIGTLCLYQFTPTNLINLLRGNIAESGAFYSQGFEIAAIYLFIKLFSFYNNRSVTGWSVKTDLYLTHGTPNIFLWISIITSLGAAASFAPFWGSLLFFAGIFIDEVLFVNLFKLRFSTKLENTPHQVPQVIEQTL